MFGLFKTKLSEYNHKYTVNYLISEEASAQWQYHVQENNFDKNSFRGQPFAKNTVKLFIDNYLKMKVDDKLLTTIVDLGYRKCSEWIDDYRKLEKKVSKIKYESLVKILAEYLYMSSNLENGKFSHLKFDHQKAMRDGMGDVDFRKRFKSYNVLMQLMRDMDCHMRTALTHKKTESIGRVELDHLIQEEENKILKSSDKKRDDILNKLIKESEAKFADRNLFNEIGN